MAAVKKTEAAASTSPAKSIYMPTPEQLATALRSLADNAEKTHKAKALSKPPAGASKATPINIQVPHRLGASREAYIIKGIVYVKTQVISPTAKPHWEKIGPQPMF